MRPTHRIEPWLAAHRAELALVVPAAHGLAGDRKREHAALLRHTAHELAERSRAENYVPGLVEEARAYYLAAAMESDREAVRLDALGHRIARGER